MDALGELPTRLRSETAPRAVSKTSLFGIPVAQVTYNDVVELVNDALAEPGEEALTVDAVNAMGMSEACTNPRMREALLGYDVVAPDGKPLVWCMNAKGAELRDRVYGPYMTDRVLAGLERPTRVAVIGGFGEVHEWLRTVGPSRYPNARFRLLYDAPTGPIDEAYVETCIDLIRRCGAQLVFVALGVPRQYYWTSLAREHLEGGQVCLSIGGAFDLVSGQTPYAPAWMQRSGLTWLYRMIREPRRLGPRYLKYNPTFLWLLATRELISRDVARGAPWFSKKRTRSHLENTTGPDAES
jgi:N-acetylglucosaminyldiphosphoundecaprenol N-acetyl-beta-D-mannosaminyltransferase